MLFEPGRTQFDLNFSLFGTQVRVHPAFWLVAAFLGWRLMEAGIAVLLVWIVCVFISILVHEFGHISMGRLFGSHGHIVLYSFGGLAVGSNQLNSRWQRIAVSFAGPLAGFVLGGAAFALVFFRVIPNFENAKLKTLLYLAVDFLIEISIYWGVMNLLPVFPLDGGQISRELWEWGSPRRGLVYCLRLSMAFACLVVFHSLVMEMRARQHATWYYPLDILGGDLYMALLFGSLAAGNYQMLAAQRDFNQHWDDRWEDWDQERDRWDRDDDRHSRR